MFFLNKIKVNTHFSPGKNVLKKYWKKTNIDITN